MPAAMTPTDAAGDAGGLLIPARVRDLGGFHVGCVLPHGKCRMVGPFVFLDHMGPLQLTAPVPRAADLRPHPHIGLATVTYLFDGELTHRDSLGIEQVIRPGEVNWMTAGRGISHSLLLSSDRAANPDRSVFLPKVSSNLPILKTWGRRLEFSLKRITLLITLFLSW